MDSMASGWVGGRYCSNTSHPLLSPTLSLLTQFYALTVIYRCQCTSLAITAIINSGTIMEGLLGDGGENKHICVASPLATPVTPSSACFSTADELAENLGLGRAT